MKILSFLLLLTFLASCSGETVTPVQEEVQNDQQEVQTNQEVSEEISNLEMSEEDTQKVTTLNYTYNNTKADVEMEISYELDNEGKISTINITSSNWDLENFNTGAQEQLVGLTLEEATEVGVISGSSLATQAFKEAIKTQL